MADREKVLDILERCMLDPADCEGCQFLGKDEWCEAKLIEVPKVIVSEAIELLKADEQMISEWTKHASFLAAHGRLQIKGGEVG